jgi:hypothetical protein
LTALIVERMLVEFIDTTKTPTANPNPTDLEVGEEEVLM